VVLTYVGNSETKYQYGKKSTFNHKRPNVINNNFHKYDWDVYSHNGQNTCCISSTNSASIQRENSMKNDHNIKYYTLHHILIINFQIK